MDRPAGALGVLHDDLARHRGLIYGPTFACGECSRCAPTTVPVQPGGAGSALVLC